MTPPLSPHIDKLWLLQYFSCLSPFFHLSVFNHVLLASAFWTGSNVFWLPAKLMSKCHLRATMIQNSYFLSSPMQDSSSLPSVSQFLNSAHWAPSSFSSVCRQTIRCSCETRWETWCLSLHRFSLPVFCFIFICLFFRFSLLHISPPSFLSFPSVVYTLLQLFVLISLLYLPHPFLSISLLSSVFLHFHSCRPHLDACCLYFQLFI